MHSTRYSCRNVKKLEFSRHIFEKKKACISNLIKIRPVGEELLYADRQKDKRADRRSDMMELIVAFLNFWNARKNNGNKSTENLP